MKKIAITALAAVALLTICPAKVSAASAKKEVLDNRIEEVNNIAKKKNMMTAAIHGVSVETGVSEERLNELHAKRPDIGAAGLMIACVMADKTKKGPDTFLQKKASGKSWTQIMNDENLNMDAFNERLSHLENYLQNGQDTKDTKARRRRS